MVRGGIVLAVGFVLDRRPWRSHLGAWDSRAAYSFQLFARFICPSLSHIRSYSDYPVCIDPKPANARYILGLRL
jgi:hypothetical protein